jgi:hypothetical protein
MRSWLWPDHVIGKRESRRLRDEHNAAVNEAGKLAEALEGMMRAFAWNAETTVKEAGEDALQSDVRRARSELLRFKEGGTA